MVRRQTVANASCLNSLLPLDSIITGLQVFYGSERLIIWLSKLATVAGSQELIKAWSFLIGRQLTNQTANKGSN